MRGCLQKRRGKLLRRTCTGMVPEQIADVLFILLKAFLSLH